MRLSLFASGLPRSGYHDSSIQEVTSGVVRASNWARSLELAFFDESEPPYQLAVDVVYAEYPGTKKERRIKLGRFENEKWIPNPKLTVKKESGE